MELGDGLAQKSRVGVVDRARDPLDELRPDLAGFAAHGRAVEHRSIGGMGNVHIIGHAAPRRFDRIKELV
jgi:hypothetical protein